MIINNVNWFSKMKWSTVRWKSRTAHPPLPKARAAAAGAGRRRRLAAAGLIELHTDNLDKFFTPRPKVDWPAHSAMSSHDALMVASGITTVLDAVAIGDVRDGGDRLENLEKMINAVEETQKRGLNRAEHRLHLRCELPHHTTLPLFEKLVDREPVSMVSLMDHSPASVSTPIAASTAITIRANII
jgi:phosphonate metabolism protein PhnM